MEQAWRLLTRSHMDKLARGCDMVVPEGCDDTCQSIHRCIRTFSGNVSNTSAICGWVSQTVSRSTLTSI